MSLTPYCSRICSTTQHRRLGLRSLPRPHPSGSVSPEIPPLQDSSVWLAPLQLLHPFCLLFSPAVARSHCGLRFFASSRCGLPIRDFLFHLPEQHHDLVWFVSLHRQVQFFFRILALSLDTSNPVMSSCRRSTTDDQNVTLEEASDSPMHCGRAFTEAFSYGIVKVWQCQRQDGEINI